MRTHEAIYPIIEVSSTKPAKMVWHTCTVVAVLAEADVRLSPRVTRRPPPSEHMFLTH